jgi:hypothetical protein
VLIKAAVLRPLREVALALVDRLAEGFGPVRVSLDVDPVSML